MSSGEAPRCRISLTVNGEPVEAVVEPRTHLADFLREERLLTGTHIGCEQGVCGACTVMIDGRPSRSCITLAAACAGAEIRTIESFDDDPLMARLREAFTRHHGLQCGFCTPGFLATAYDVARRLPGADADRVRREISGNLCRCTGYAGAVAAISEVLAEGPPAAALQPRPRGRRRVETVGEAKPTAPAAGAPSPASSLTPPEEIVDGFALTRSLVLDAPPEEVWRVLEDLESVAACVPGARLERIEGSRAWGSVTVALGPIRAHFDGVADVAFDAGARRGRVIGRGADRLSRSTLDGELKFALSPEEGAATRLELEMLYRLKGPLAQFGRGPIVEEVADRLLDDTARSIAAKARGEEAPQQSSISAWTLFLAMIRGLYKSVAGRR